MTTVEINENDVATIAVGAAVSAKFRGAFCEATVTEVERRTYCRVAEKGRRRTVKVRGEDVRGALVVGGKVHVESEGLSLAGVVLKVIDSSLYHVVFNDGDTGILRRNQLLLKGDRHYKLSECLDRLPLTNPEDFKKSVVNEKHRKEKVDADDDDDDEIKSCSQESMTTVSSSKTRSRQPNVASTTSVDTGCSSVTTKVTEDVPKTPTSSTKPKRNLKTKYTIGTLVIVNKAILKFEVESSERLDKTLKPFIGLIISSVPFESCYPIKIRHCVVKSFQDDHCYVTCKKDLDMVVKRDILIKYKESDPSSSIYIERCALYFDLKILPTEWDTAKLLVPNDIHRETSRKSDKIINKSKIQSPRTSISSLDSSSNDADNSDDDSDYSNEDDQNAKDEWVARFYGFWEDKGSPINNALEIMEREVDIYRLYELVKEYGGFQKVNSSIRWPILYHVMKLPCANSDNYQKLQMMYKKYIFPYVDMKKKLGTFEQIRNRRFNDTPIVNIKKVRPLLSARERRGCQSGLKKTEEYSASSQSVCERITDKVVSGDEVGANSAVGDMCQLSQCSSSPKQVLEKQLECEDETLLNNQVATLPPGTMVSVSYGNDKIYKAKIINQHRPGDIKPPRSRSPSFSNAGSTNSTINDLKSDIEGSILYRVHYIGWNTRHDEIVASDRIISVLSDAGHDSQSVCSSSRDSQHAAPLSDTEHSMSISQPHLEEPFNAPIVDDNELPPDICDVSHDVEIVDSDQVNETDSKPDLFVIAQCDDLILKEEEEKPCVEQSTEEWTRRRSHSENVITEKPVAITESRFITSLNLSKAGDKMPQRPSSERLSCKDEKIVLITKDNKELVTAFTSKRHSFSENDNDIVSKVLKLEHSPLKTERSPSPSSSNDSISDASTISFRNADQQSFYYMSLDDEECYGRNISERKVTKTIKTRGRKRLYNFDKKVPKKIKDYKLDAIERESNSSQHSDSVCGKRITRSIKAISEQNAVDDNSQHLEEDSQTSQDGSVFPHPSFLPLDFRASMTPLATGTPTSSKGRRPKGRRKYRNSQSNSSAECAYQDSNGEINPLQNFDNFHIPKASTNSPLGGHRSTGRVFQRLHPSLIPHDLQKLPPEDRIKLLESLIRQTHINFLDTKDKLKYVEKRISEIKSSRANGHCIESDEDKFR